MSYIDAFLERDKDRINVVERIKGKREYRQYPTKYIFYYPDPKGKFRSIYGRPVSKFSTKHIKEFDRERKLYSHQKLHESDINPIFRCLEENYLGIDSPVPHVCFFDIEVDFNKDRGFAPAHDPHEKITAITLYLNWLPEDQRLITLCLKPEKLDQEIAEAISVKYDNTVLCHDEKELLDMFLKLIDDADILSGWNSEGFDIPYIINRTQLILSRADLSRYCLWDKYPRKRKYIKYGNEQETYDLIGRVHLDYLELYRKYTYHEMHSYRLDAIGDYEIGEKKVPYDGTLDQLYNNDFEKFIAYSRQDVALLAKLDDKLKFIDLANELAHANTVLLQTTMGAVAVTEQAIINESHKRGFVIPDRKKGDNVDTTPAVGAYVAFPKKGLHNWIGSLDINSLYPSVIRALNMGPETIVGQLRLESTKKYIDNKMKEGKSAADAWEGLFGTLEYKAVIEKDIGVEIVCDFEDGFSDSKSGAEWYKIIFESGQDWCLSSNGTIFRTDVKAVVPGLLESWYSERKVMQRKMREAENQKQREFWDKRQLVKKINLNSLYGAILNPGCRFFDKRIGQSTTLSGRQISKHMAAKINEVITGEYNHVGKAIIYGDTDSAYFSAYEVLKKEIDAGQIPWTKESVVKLYDQVAGEVNNSFKSFMGKAFHCSRSRAEVIQAGRESVATSGLFITKKRYAILIYDLEGFRTDQEGSPGKIKAMGLDLKRSDTPVYIQDFLSELLLMVLTGNTEEKVLDRITQFRNEFKTRPGWEKGSPRRANNIGEYAKKEARQGKANMPGHVRASINWNTLKRMNGDKYSQEIMDGMKVIVCKLKKNPLDYTSVAYPTDELRLPLWFKELPFDDATMESTVIDNKLGNLLGVLGWDIKSTESNNTFNNLFDFGG